MPLTWPPGNPLRIVHEVLRYWVTGRSGSRASAAVENRHNSAGTASSLVRRPIRPRCLTRMERSGKVLELLNNDLSLMLERPLGVVEAAQVHAYALASRSRDA